MTANLEGVRHAYGLCFVRAPWVYFTRLTLDQQWGDGWERVPYEQHAGPPYADSHERILTVAFDGPLYTPDLGYDSKERSVNEINRGEMPWLRTQSFVGNAPIHIMAGVTLESFVEQVELAGGHVFAPLGWGALRLGPTEYSASSDAPGPVYSTVKASSGKHVLARASRN